VSKHQIKMFSRLASMSAPSPTVELPVLSVSELTQSIRQELEGRFPVVYVQGEVTNYKQHTSGHLYFTLKDEEAQISAVMFAGNARTVSKLPASGDKVIVRAQLSVYPARGNYQLYVKELHYVGLGELLARFQALKEQLRAMGWMDPSRKQALPFLPKRIGVVTSPTGAVIQDILHVLRRRFPGFQLILNPVKVQGEGAAQEIAQAIDQMNALELCDVLIVGRGGGSLEDLWAFNELPVAEALHRSRIPTISAVGHETDVCIADFIADVRAPTPSAAAELVMPSQEELQGRLNQLQLRLRAHLRQLVQRWRGQLGTLGKHPALVSPDWLVGRRAQRVDEMAEALRGAMGRQLARQRALLAARRDQCSALNPLRKLREVRRQLEAWPRALQSPMAALIRRRHESLIALAAGIERALHKQLETKKSALQSLAQHLEAIDPQHLLRKGYTLLFEARTGRVVLSATQLQVGESIAIQLADGRAEAQVTHVESGGRDG
jgi:exodeoxyribonuclease VII large subunit